MFAIEREVFDLLSSVETINNMDILGKNYPHPNYPDSRLGYAKETSLTTLVLLARDVGCNLVVKYGINGKWYLKKCDPDKIDERVKRIKENDLDRVKNCITYVLKFK